MRQRIESARRGVVVSTRFCGFSLQITGSPPLLSDLDTLCEMEHEGHSLFLPVSR